MLASLGMVFAIVLIAMVCILALAFRGGKKEFAAILAGIATASVVALFQSWPF